MKKFIKFVGPWINGNSVAVYENDEKTVVLSAENSHGCQIVGSIDVVIKKDELSEITSDPYNTAQHTITALSMCGCDA